MKVKGLYCLRHSCSLGRQTLMSSVQVIVNLSCFDLLNCNNYALWSYLNVLVKPCCGFHNIPLHFPLLESRSMLTTMATTTARPPALLSAVLLIYPATLLLGSLFSTISPTARHSRDLFVSSPHPASPLAPSLAADMHLSEGPVNYFARKNNVFNIYFVKIGWLWTTAAFVSLLITQPVFSSSLRESSSQQEARFRRTLQAILRYALTTTVWYLATQWFFGPAIIDRGFVATGQSDVFDACHTLATRDSTLPHARVTTDTEPGAALFTHDRAMVGVVGMTLDRI